MGGWPGRSPGMNCEHLPMCRAVVWPGTNCENGLVAAGIENLSKPRIHGVAARRGRVVGGPAPGSFLVGAWVLCANPARAAGTVRGGTPADPAAVPAACRWVAGAGRRGQAQGLPLPKADFVVRDLIGLLERR